MSENTEKLIEKLPAWDLSSLYLSMNDNNFKNDIQAIKEDIAKFKQKYLNKIKKLSAVDLGKSIEEYNNLCEKIAKLICYAQLLQSQDLRNQEIAKFFQNTFETVSDLNQEIIFYELEINQIDDEILENKIKEENNVLKKYSWWLKILRLYKPHQLSNKEEEILNQCQISGRQSWIRLYDETMASLEINVDGQENPLGVSEVINLLTNRDEKIRENAAQAFSKKLTEIKSLMAMITNTLAKDKNTEDKIRNFSKCYSSRNLENQIEDEVVDALVEAVTESYEKLSHRYYKMKAKWFNTEQLSYWDRNAPIPFDDDRKYSWSEAKDIVISAYGKVSPEMSKIVEMFYDNNWLDAEAYLGKTSGAFSSSTVPSANPFILLNWYGKSRDVMTLAHELGHGIHQYLSKEQGYILSRTPLTLAETASVFGEMLTFEEMISREKDTKIKKAMIAKKVEDMLNTVVRQIAFYHFESEIHNKRKSGELSVEEINQIWLKHQKLSLGDGIKIDDSYSPWWSYISHFIHAPFYVYAYAFGDCLVNSLYKVYKDGTPNFIENYINILKSGGSKGYNELLSPMGLDLKSKSFWLNGLDRISKFIDQLEK